MVALKLNGTEPISQASTTVQDFWAWAYSDILSNCNRSVFAEYLVAVALGLTDQPRIEWDAVDLRYCGKKLEVKSAAYIQSWQQTKLSSIKFDISKKNGWDSNSNLIAQKATRSADCYVFCIYQEQNKQDSNVLDLDKWLFTVVKTEKINEVFGDQKSTSLSRLEQLGQVSKYEKLKQTIDSVLGLLDHATSDER